MKCALALFLLIFFCSPPLVSPHRWAGSSVTAASYATGGAPLNVLVMRLGNQFHSRDYKEQCSLRNELEIVMRAFRLEITLAEDGALRLNALPFQKGETVEVIVLERPPVPDSLPAPPLKGSVLRYDDPTKPVALDDREAL